MTSFILVFFGVFIIKTRTCQLHVFEGIKINKKFPPCYISYALSSRKSISEIFSLKRQKLQFNSHSCLLTADGNFDGMKNCIFSALSSTRKRGDEVLFRNHAMTSKTRLYPLTCVLEFARKPDLGNLSSRDIIYLPETTKLSTPRQILLRAHAKFPEVPLEVYYTRRGNSFYENDTK